MTNQQTQIKYVVIYPLSSKIALLSASGASILVALIGIILELSLYTILFRAVMSYLIFLGLGWLAGLFVEDVIKTLEQNKENQIEGISNENINLASDSLNSQNSSLSSSEDLNLSTNEPSLLKEPVGNINLDNLTAELDSIKI